MKKLPIDVEDYKEASAALFIGKKIASCNKGSLGPAVFRVDP